MHEDDNGPYVLYDDVINLFNPGNVAKPEGFSPKHISSVIYNDERGGKMFKLFKREYNNKGQLVHIRKEGSREHVLYWDSNGCHCSEKDCEINYKNKLASHCI